MLRSILLATVAFAGISSVAQAQEAVSTKVASAPDTFDEVVITATRRETSLQSTPVTVSAISADSLTTLGVTRVDQVAPSVPNFYVAPGVANSSTVSVSMRGRGDNSGGFGLSEQPVGFYFDDVYQARPSAVNSDFSDIERIEVLRGPQGTLFGRNSMTGAVNIISATPDDDFTGNASVSYGSYQTLRLKGALSGPLVEGKLAASIAGVYSDMGKGYVEQVPTGKSVDERDFWGLRGKLHYYGLDGFSAVLTASHTENSNDGFVATPVNTTMLEPLPGNYRKTYSPLDSRGATEVDSLSLHIKADLGFADFKSISGYSKTSDEWLVDLSGGVKRPSGEYITGFERHSVIKSEQFSQEFQLMGDALNDKLSWILGLYYFHEGVSQSLNDNIFYPSTETYRPSNELFYDATTDAFAAYAQLNYTMAEGLEVQVGGRYSYEKKGIEGYISPTQDYDGKASFKSFTPKVGISYQATPEFFLYGSVSKGFRSGGFPSGATVLLVAETPYGPESVWAYEVGFKSDLFDRKLRFNLTGYLNDFSDLVVSSFASGTAVIVQANGLSERVIGLEAELNARPFKGLEIYANGGIQDESKMKFIEGAQVPADLQRNAVVPYYTGMVGFRYEFPLDMAETYNLRFGADYVVRDEMFSNINNLPVTKTSDIRELNAEITLTSDAGWSTRVVGRNLTDRDQWKNGIGLGFINVASRQAVEPRTIMFEVGYKF